jgi:hydroxypyruvate reductase
MASARRLLERVFVRALSSVDLRERTRTAASDLVRGPSCVLAIGKAAESMLDGARRAIVVDRALAIIPAGAPFALRDRRVTVHRAAHPIPDRSSVDAAERALAFARDHEGTLVVLVSGGASSLVCAPCGVSLAKKRAIVRALLRADATILEVNVVRRHLSRIKGGGVLDAAAAARVVTIVASDVIGGGPHDIGSGPSVPDPTTRADARRVYARFIGGDPPPFVETRKPSRGEGRRHPVRIVARPEDLARAAEHELARAGYRVRALSARLGDVESFAVEYARVARRLAPGEAVVRAAEPSLRVAARGAGKGGRSSHLAAALWPRLPTGVAFLAGASDGVDGSSGAAGAVVIGGAPFDENELLRALAAFDTGTLHARYGTAIVLGPTGHNLADLHVLARPR